MHTEQAQRRDPFDEQDGPERPNVSASLDRIQIQCDALEKCANVLANRLEAVLLQGDGTTPSSTPQPRQPAPPLVERLDDLLDRLAFLTRRIDDLGDRVAL